MQHVKQITIFGNAIYDKAIYGNAMSTGTWDRDMGLGHGIETWDWDRTKPSKPSCLVNCSVYFVSSIGGKMKNKKNLIFEKSGCLETTQKHLFGLVTGVFFDPHTPSLDQKAPRNDPFSSNLTFFQSFYVFLVKISGNFSLV